MQEYLSADIICSEKRTVFQERSSRKTVSYEDKYPSIFSPQMEAIVFIILQIFFATVQFSKLGNILGYSPVLAGEYSVRDVLRPIAHERKDLVDYKKHYQFTLSYIWKNALCSSRNIHTPPTEGIGISWMMGGSARPKNLKKCMKPNWNFQRGWGVFPSMGEVWIFSGITQYT